MLKILENLQHKNDFKLEIKNIFKSKLFNEISLHVFLWNTQTSSWLP
jgi:hypothetical protein